MMKGAVKLLKRHWFFVLIFAVGIFLRSYKAAGWFSYGHDQDLNGWVIRDILENGHLRLIGQETSSNGVFIGPLFYYLLIPFYLIFKMDPKGGLILPIILSGFSIGSFYYIFTKVFNSKVGVLASLIYSLSTIIVFTDREVVPTQPAVLWGIWFFYALWLLLKGKQKAVITLGALIGLAWNFSLGLTTLAPLILIAHVLSKKALDIKSWIIGLAALILILSPFLVFETRHDFSQSRAVFASLTSDKDYITKTAKGYSKLDRVMQLVYRNTTRLTWGSDFNIPGKLAIILLVLLFIFSYKKTLISKNLAIIMGVWLGIFILFFSVNSINVSEYYLNGMNVIWIGILAVGLFGIISKNKALGIFLIFVFVAVNIYGFVTHPEVTNGYLQRKQLAEFIKNDAETRKFPCVSVSFITSPGNDLGYRYFFWLTNLHINHPDSGSPVYTIAFPHSMVGRLDKSFGSLGLVLPGYERYTKRTVEESCKGENSNLTDPMLKFTK